jgi:hypothetical protein
VKLAGDARAVIGNFAGLHRKSKVRAFWAKSVDRVLVVNDQDILISHLCVLALTSWQLTDSANLIKDASSTELQF